MVIVFYIIDGVEMKLGLRFETCLTQEIVTEENVHAR